MTSKHFLTFDPFMSFDESSNGYKEKIFLRADGQPTETRWYGESRNGKGYLNSLWRAGRDAYATLAEKCDTELTADFFEENLIAIAELEKNLIPHLQQLSDDGILHLRLSGEADVVENVTSALGEACRGAVADVFMRCLMPLTIAGDLPGGEVEDFESIFLIVAISHIDSCIVADQIGADMSEALEQVMNNIASAKLYRETIDAAKGAVSAAGRRSAKARHFSNNQQRATALADWEAEGHNFSSMRAFARECYKRYDVTDFTTVYNWLREHRKSKT